VETRELCEDLLEHESLGDCIRINICYGQVRELGPLGSKDVVVTDVAVALVVLGDDELLLLNVLSNITLNMVTYQSIIIEIDIPVVVLVRVKADSPITGDDEVDFGHIALFKQDVPVSLACFIPSWHETKGHLVDKVRIELFAAVEESFERSSNDDIAEQELSHDELLDPVRDGVKVLLLFKEDFAAILIPVVTEVSLDLLLQLTWDVKSASVGLVLDTTDQEEPLLKLLIHGAIILHSH